MLEVATVTHILPIHRTQMTSNGGWIQRLWIYWTIRLTISADFAVTHRWIGRGSARGWATPKITKPYRNASSGRSMRIKHSSSLRWNCWTHLFSLWYSFPKMMPSLWQTLSKRSCSWEPRIPSNLDWNWQILAWKDMKRLMTYVAGMICFACQPEWSAYVWRNGLGEVVGLWRVWSGCPGCIPSHHGLAKRLHIALPDFSMFFSRVEIWRWLRSVHAPHSVARCNKCPAMSGEFRGGEYKQIEPKFRSFFK